MSRDEAIEKLKISPFNKESIDEEFKFIATKLGISSGKLREYFNLPKKFYWDYKNQQSLFNIGAKILKILGVEKSIKR